MVLFFDLEKLEEQSKDEPTKFIAMLENHLDRSLPTKYTRSFYSKVPLHGRSFLLNSEELFKDKSTDILYKVQYIKLAARRDWILYKQYRYKSLQISYFPDLRYDVIRSNPLLEITQTEINFKYER